ncbi:MAG: rhodanese-like domain-containing protein [Bacteroidota bacterium]
MNDLTVAELKQKIDNKEDFVLIDVRETYEHDEFNIGGTLIPLGNLTQSFPSLEDAKDKEVVVYCRSGNRSGMAKQLMIAAGFSNVKNTLGGMLAWQEMIK